jgi:hypothetical protein
MRIFQLHQPIDASTAKESPRISGSILLEVKWCQIEQMQGVNAKGISYKAGDDKFAGQSYAKAEWARARAKGLDFMV